MCEIHVLRFDDYEEIYRGRERQIKKKKKHHWKFDENTWAILFRKNRRRRGGVGYSYIYTLYVYTDVRNAGRSLLREFIEVS